MNTLCQSDELLIVGDSYCADRNRLADWPRLLLKMATGDDEKPRGEGWPGASWWSTRHTLLKEFSIKEPKILIICHTEAMRIPSNYHFGLNAASVTGKFPICSPYENLQYYTDDIKKSAEMYYKHLISEDFHHWAMHSWFRELDNLLIDKNIQTIHLQSFRIDNVFKSGITSKERLSDLYDRFGQVKDGIPRANHFSNEHNILIAKNLYRALCAQLETGKDYDLGLLQ
jgi:hypothetical protein